MNEHEKINYVELPAQNIESTKEFFSRAFGWEFEDFGPDYAAFSNQGLDGGFFKADLKSLSQQGAALVMFYSEDLEATQRKVENSVARQ